MTPARSAWQFVTSVSCGWKEGRYDGNETVKRLDAFDFVILAVLAAMIVLSPLAMGSVAPWAKNTIFVLSLLVFFLWIAQAMKRGKIVFVTDPVYIFIGLFILVVCLQLVPIGPGLMEKVSPSTVEVYTRTLPEYPESGEARTLSLTSYHTAWELRRIASFILIFLVIVNTFRTRVQVLTLILAMIAVGVFEAIYGFTDFLAGGKSIFWNERVIGGHRVSGTFINKNHFAGLLEMIVPMTLGLCMAIVPGHIRGSGFKARAAEAISSTGLHRQILLGGVIVLMTTAIFFSLSRAGMSATVGAWIPFFLLMGLATGSRRFTLTILLLILGILCVFFSADTDVVVDSVEAALTGETISWHARIDIWQSCWPMISDFPLLGTGLGTFKEAFERYQSSLFGDKYAAFAHNDWLQVICETGFLGGFAVIGGILLLFFRLSRRTLERKDTFCRWIATGALAGCLAILIHSFFDFNLYKITSNGLVFAVILGLWHVAASMKGNRMDSPVRARTVTLSLASRPVRAAVVLAVAVMTVYLSIQPVRSAAADIRFNRYLALTGTELEQSLLYHFLPNDVVPEGSSPREEALQELSRARELDDKNPLYLFFLGVEKAREADALIVEKASSVANNILGPGSSDSSEEQTAVEEALFSALVNDPDMASLRRPSIEAAERFVSGAIKNAPSTSIYHLFLADLVSETGGSVPLPKGGVSRAALWLAPNKPGTLFHAGKISLLSVIDNEGNQRRSPDLSSVFDLFRSCISSDASYTEKIYPLIMDTLGGTEHLFSATPDTIEGYEQLTRTLQESGKWNAALSGLDKLRRLSGLPGDSEIQDEARLLDIQMSVSQRRAEILGILGRYEERRQESRVYRTLLRKKNSEEIGKVFTLCEERRYSDAYEAVLHILEDDWSNPDALVAAADLARMPGVTDSFPDPGTSADHLFRLVVLNESICSRLEEKALEIIGKLTPEKEEGRFFESLVEGSVLVLSGRCDKGLEILDQIGGSEGKYRHLDHLVHYFQGKAYEGRGLHDLAQGAYEKVLQEVPRHRRAIERLATLFPGISSNGLENPEHFTGIDFGGKVRLVGYSRNRTSDSGDADGKSITLQWELVDQDAEKCSCRIQLLDKQMEEISQETRRFMDFKEKPLDFYYCGEMVDQRTDLEGDRSQTEYIKIWISSKDASLLKANHCERYVILRILP